MAQQIKKAWCVQHRAGWCATANGERSDEAATNVPTLCGHVVILPGGSEKRVPDCSECQDVMAKEQPIGAGAV